MHATYPSNLTPFYFITLIFDEQEKLLSFSSCIFLNPVIISFLLDQIQSHVNRHPLYLNFLSSFHSERWQSFVSMQNLLSGYAGRDSDNLSSDNVALRSTFQYLHSSTLSVRSIWKSLSFVKWFVAYIYIFFSSNSYIPYDLSSWTNCAILFSILHPSRTYIACRCLKTSCRIVDSKYSSYIKFQQPLTFCTNSIKRLWVLYTKRPFIISKFHIYAPVQHSGSYYIYNIASIFIDLLRVKLHSIILGVSIRE
jgi:hypothetical protein